MWTITGTSLLASIVLGLCFGFGFTVGAKLANALFGKSTT